MFFRVRHDQSRFIVDSLHILFFPSFSIIPQRCKIRHPVAVQLRLLPSLLLQSAGGAALLFLRLLCGSKPFLFYNIPRQLALPFFFSFLFFLRVVMRNVCKVHGLTAAAAPAWILAPCAAAAPPDPLVPPPPPPLLLRSPEVCVSATPAMPSAPPSVRPAVELRMLWRGRGPGPSSEVDERGPLQQLPMALLDFNDGSGHGRDGVDRNAIDLGFGFGRIGFDCDRRV